jgi:hypothetical protein
MDTYYATSTSGGCCFGENSTVIVVDASGKQTETRVINVLKGDKVMVSVEKLATVRCLVRITRDAIKPLLSFSTGLTITKRHPIRINDTWMLPN